ncbi:MAG TPA: peptidylprolyl isomerase, partial [Solirubrobacteraceae bacterium]|nr:peptidylprolyl isomerase [Solirubrobacteraceae bacterium]
RGEVDHWASAVERGSSVGTTLGPMSGTPGQRALEFLISSSWIIGEAEAQGLSISNAAIQRGLQDKFDALPNGRSEFDEELSRRGQTLADVKLEIESALAVAKLRNAVAKRVPAVTGAEVARYYSHHRQKFYLPDRRVAYVIEGIHNHAHALAVARLARSGARLNKPWFREIVSRTPGIGDRELLVNMIFATPLGRTTRPVMINHQWVLALVRKLIPAGIQSLATVRGELSKILAAQRRARALERVATAYVRKWTASTSCRPGYVVQKCSQYRGGLAPGAPLTGT